MANDRTVRFLHALGSASTSRVLNLGQIARTNKDNPDHAERPLFRAPNVNTAFIIKHRTRSDESYMFSATRTVATKLILPFDHGDLRAGGRSLLIDQRGFVESLRAAGNYNPENLERDLVVLRLLNGLPSLDPFLLREHLRNNDIDVAPCYFAISAGDQERMHAFVSAELSRLVTMATGEHGDSAGGSTSRMVSALLSSKVDEKLEPLRLTLGLTGNDFREGVFSWRGFLYYKWSMENIWPDVMHILREVKEIRPHGAVDVEQRAFLTAARRKIIESMRDNGVHVSQVLRVYDESFSNLIAQQTPKMFRDFLLSAPQMFLSLGEKMGAISHIVSFWRYRFPLGHRPLIAADELATIFQDFTGGFVERDNAGSGLAIKPEVQVVP